MDTEKARLKIRIGLLEKGIKQRSIAKDLDYTPAFVNMVLQGKKKPTKKFNDWIEKNLGVMV
jgi:predicted transcriptional regulator